MSGLVPHGTLDPVEVYDAMREAANRLVAAHVARVTAGGPGDPELMKARDVRERALAVDPLDLEAQRAAADAFAVELAALRD